MLTDTVSNNTPLLGWSLKLFTSGTNSIALMSSCLWRQAYLTPEDLQQQFNWNLIGKSGKLSSLLPGLFSTVSSQDTTSFFDYMLTNQSLKIYLALYPRVKVAVTIYLQSVVHTSVE